tara:strand:- start:294 stop:554 length:261 start_codon:yes stop_codon:yes gene_type:complete
MAKKLTKKAKVFNLLSKGNPVSWTTLRTRFDLSSPRAMIDTLRNEGLMIYTNKSKSGTSYRVGTPSKAVIAAGQRALSSDGNYAYS